MEDKTYKIIAVSQTPAKPYTNNFGTTYYRDVRLADEQGNEHAKPVSLGKKSEDAFVVGAELFGHIFVEQGRPTDKFKAASKQQGSFGGGFGSSTPAQPSGNTYSGSSKPSYQPRDDKATQESIARSVALKAAVDFWVGLPGSNPAPEMVEQVADRFLVWLQGGETPNPKALATSSTSPTTSNKSWVVDSRTNALWPSDRKAEDSGDAEAQSLYASIASAEEFPESDLPPGTF